MNKLGVIVGSDTGASKGPMCDNSMTGFNNWFEEGARNSDTRKRIICRADHRTVGCFSLALREFQKIQLCGRHLHENSVVSEF